MKKYLSGLLNEAVKNSDINTIKALYNGSPHEPRIKFEYARLLIKNGNTTLGKKLLIELLDSKNKNYALLELGLLSVTEKDLIKAKECFNELLSSEYINDECCALLELGRIESFYGDKDKAREYFKRILNIKKNDYYAMMELSRLEAENEHIEEAKMMLSNLIKRDKNKSSSYARNLLGIILFNNNEHDKLIKLIYENNRFVPTLSIIIYLGMKYNVIFNIDYENIRYGYTALQLIDYDEYASIEHIIERHTLENDSSKFNSKIDVYKLFNDIKNELTLDNKINKLVFNDIYSIYYPNIGGHGENYLRVITLPNSKNILTMYPICGKYDIDIYDDEEKSFSRIKTKN